MTGVEVETSQDFVFPITACNFPGDESRLSPLKPFFFHFLLLVPIIFFPQMSNPSGPNPGSGLQQQSFLAPITHIPGAGSQAI